MIAPLPPDEAVRQAKLDSYAILDTGDEASFDDITLLASHILDAPIAAISLVDRNRQYFKSRRGMEIRETPRDAAFCAHSILNPTQVMVVPDATRDARFVDNPFVTGSLNVRFYAGAPLVAPDGSALGSLCVIDQQPRTPTPAAIAALHALSRQVVELMEARQHNRELAEAMAGMKRHKRMSNEAERLAHLGAWELDLTVGHLHWSDEVFRIHELPLDRKPTLDEAVDFYAPEARPVIARAVALAVQDGTPFDLVLPLVTAQGNARWVRAIGRPDGREAGARERVWGVFQDITDERRQQQDLERYRTIINHMTDVVMIKDREHRYELVNPAFCKAVGLPAEQVVGRRNVDLFGPTNGRGMHDRETAAALTGEPQTYEEDLSLQGERQRWLTTRIPIRDADGKVSNVVGICRNVEGQRLAQELLEHARADADAANRAKSEFLANMSHEIRTPMTAILGFCDVLNESSDDRLTTLDAIETIRRNGEHLMSLINDILDVSKIEAGQMRLESIPLDFDALIHEVLPIVRQRADRKAVAVRLERTSRVPKPSLGDPTRLRQVLINLLGNAVKFTERGEVTLRIGGRQLDDAFELRVDVVDTGIGMTPAEVANLFQTFRQADESTTRRFGGTGLGLTISRNLVAMMGGTIAVQSVPGQGSTFTVILPLRAADRRAPDGRGVATTAAMGAAPAAGTLSGLRVLLVDDAPDNRRLLEIVFRTFGVGLADFAENGQVALDRVAGATRAGRPYDVVLMDMQMPVMDGYTAATELRALGFAGQIVALTAAAMAEDRARCARAGCNDYLSKPIDRVQLRALLDAVADSTGRAAA